MVLVDSDLRLVKSAHTVGNINSLGGEMTDIVVIESTDSLWDEVKDSELSSSVVGEYEVRCVYARNFSLNNETLQNCQVWVEQNTAAPFTDVDIGIGTAQMGDVEQTVASEDTLPDNINWTFARGEENAEFIGDLAPDKGKSLWIRRHAGPTRSGMSYPSDNYILRFKFLRTGALNPPPPGPGPPPSGNDPFGVRMIYATQTAGGVSSPFFMNMNDPYSDCRFNTTTGDRATKNGDGSWALGPSPRIRLYSSQPGCARDIYDVPLDTYDHDIWGEREYMKSPNDWKNVEITGYFKVASADPANTSERKLYLYSRTFRHNTGVGGGCSGTAYKGVIYGADQVLKFHKEAFHDGSQPCGDRSIVVVKEGIPRTDSNQWFGMKVMMWNYPNPANPNIDFVHLEIWLDLTNTNSWVKMAERDDTGGWYPGMPSTTCPGDEHCGGHQDQIIKWGGPTTEIRWDAAYTSVHFKNLSCREIIPAVTALPPPPGPPPPGPSPPPPPPGPGTDVFGITQIYASKVGGSTYAATAWGNGSSRTINRNEADSASTCYTDPSDSRFKMIGVGDPRVIIDGAGIMKATVNSGLTGSPRVIGTGTFQNVEETVYVRCPSAGMGANFDLRPKTDHYCGPTDGFGGYLVNIDFQAQTVNLRKEKTHTIGYSARMNLVAATLAANTWYGFKAVCYNVGTGVKMEAYMDTTDGANGGNWVKITEGADDGSWIQSPNQGSSIAGALRSNIGDNNQYLEFKRWTVREIDTSIVPAPPPPPGPPPPVPPGPPPPSGPVDTFGILMLNETKSGGKTWFSTAWASNSSRLLGDGNTDPFDSRFQYRNGDPSTTQLSISGIAPGEASQTQFNSSCRLFVNDAWLNTEQTIYQFVETTDNSWADIIARSRSRHETACSWGNYNVRWRDTRGDTGGQPPVDPSEISVAIEAEVMHPYYRRHIDEKAWPAGTSGMVKGQWIGFKNVTRTVTATGHVKVEGYVNYDITKQTASDWIKTNEFTFSGSNVTRPEDETWAGNADIVNCQGQGDGQANKIAADNPDMFRYTSTGDTCWWKIDGGNNMKFKYASIREINPL